MTRTRRIAVPVAAGTAIGFALVLLVGCTSSGSGSAAQGPGPSDPPVSASPTDAAPSNGIVTTPLPTGTGAPTSVPVVVPTGTKAPYPTPGRDGGAPQANQRSVLKSLPGSTAAKCQVVRNRRDVLSGSMGAGNFQQARQQFKTDYGTTEVPMLNMYAIPEHAGHLKKVTAVINPRGAGQSTRVTSKTVEPADAYRYFAMQLPVRKPGTYRISLRSGHDSGCFIVTFKGSRKSG